jgi:hypothetical protein
LVEKREHNSIKGQLWRNGRDPMEKCEKRLLNGRLQLLSGNICGRKRVGYTINPVCERRKKSPYNI